MSTQDEDAKKAEMEAFVEQVAELASKKVLSKLEAPKLQSIGETSAEELLKSVYLEIDNMCDQLGIPVPPDTALIMDNNVLRYRRIMDCLAVLQQHIVALHNAGPLAATSGLQAVPDMFSLMNAMLRTGSPIGRSHIVIQAAE